MKTQIRRKQQWGEDFGDPESTFKAGPAHVIALPKLLCPPEPTCVCACNSPNSRFTREIERVRLDDLGRLVLRVGRQDPRLVLHCELWKSTSSTSDTYCPDARVPVYSAG